MAGRAGCGRRQGRAAPRRLREGARGGPLHRRHQALRDARDARSCAARSRARRYVGSISPRRRRRPACSASSGRERWPGSRRRRTSKAAAVAGVAAETLDAGTRQPLELIEIEWDELEPLLDADEAVARGSLVIQETRRYERGDYEQGLAAGRRRRRGRVHDADAQPQLARDAPVRLRVARRRASTSTSRPSTSGGSAATWPRRLGLPQDKVRVICEFMGGGFGAKTSVGNYILLAAELAKRTGRPVRCALLPARGERRRRQSQRDAPARDRRGTGRRDADRPRRRVHVRARLVGLAAADSRTDRSCSTPARTCARSSTARS